MEEKDTKSIPVFNLFDAAGGDDSSTDFFGSLTKSNTESKGNTPVQNNNVDSLFGGSSTGGSFFDSLGQNNGPSGSTTPAPRPFESSPGKYLMLICSTYTQNYTDRLPQKDFRFYVAYLKIHLKNSNYLMPLEFRDLFKCII